MIVKNKSHLLVRDNHLIAKGSKVYDNSDEEDDRQLIFNQLVHLRLWIIELKKNQADVSSYIQSHLAYDFVTYNEIWLGKNF